MYKKTDDIETVAVIGAGTMGHGIAQFFATNGFRVFLTDKNKEYLERGIGEIVRNLQYMTNINVIQKDDIESIKSRIDLTNDLERSAESSQFITEAVTENLELKKEIFSILDEATSPDTILASNTSSFDINDLLIKVKNKSRVIGTHWFHPPHITPCVEIIPSDVTDFQVLKTTLQLFEYMGKAPTVCKSAPGFIANRIQYALVSECLAIVEEGLATPEEVDRIVKTSFGFRLSAFGPFEVLDQAGIDVYNAIFKYFYDKLGREVFRPPKILQNFVDKGKFGLKSGSGFYNYEGDAQVRIREERDTKLFNRLKLYKKEFNHH